MDHSMQDDPNSWLMKPPEEPGWFFQETRPAPPSFPSIDVIHTQGDPPGSSLAILQEWITEEKRRKLEMRQPYRHNLIVCPGPPLGMDPAQSNCEIERRRGEAAKLRGTILNRTEGRSLLSGVLIRDIQNTFGTKLEGLWEQKALRIRVTDSEGRTHEAEFPTRKLRTILSNFHLIYPDPDDPESEEEGIYWLQDESIGHNSATWTRHLVKVHAFHGGTHYLSIRSAEGEKRNLSINIDLGNGGRLAEQLRRLCESDDEG